jgi:hypothetical protein
MAADLRKVPCIAAVGAMLVFTTGAARADVVLDWNAIAVRALTTQTPALNPFVQARLAAIVQLAVFEAVNATDGRYRAYLGSAVAPSGSPIVAPAGASAEAAAIAAAHAVLVHYLSASAATVAALDAERAASLSVIPDGAAKDDGIGAGVAAAAAMIDQRVGDGSSPVLGYTPVNPGVGEWALTPGCTVGVLFNWRDVKPFGVVQPASGHWAADFRPVAPPALGSNAYAKDYDEVKRVGSATASAADRPADREVVAWFYAAASPTFVFHTAARQLAVQRGHSLAENARNLALISMATNDSLVASFAAKYYYDLWRPVTAIPAGGADGNNKTEPGAFTPLISTPCFPSYPSNHASGSNGAAEIMRRIYGAAGHAIELSATVPVIGAVTLRYSSFERICDDIDDARVYGGIHFRFDQVAGNRLGRDVATHVYKNNLQPVHPNQ